MGMLLTALDFNIVATAVPTISSEFGQYNNSSWLGTGFLISFALALPIYTKLGDMFGRRNMFIAGTIGFIIGSGLCGGSKSMNMLIASRVVQGLGAGGIYALVNVCGRYRAPIFYVRLLADIWLQIGHCHGLGATAGSGKVLGPCRISMGHCGRSRAIVRRSFFAVSMIRLLSNSYSIS
jgi:MFS family permease